MDKVPVQHVAITLDDGSLDIMSFILRGRSTDLPLGAKWDIQGDGNTWTREATRDNIDDEIVRTYTGAGKWPTKYRLIDEGDIPTDRSNRKDWKDNGKTIK